MATKDDPSNTTIIICNYCTPKILETHQDMHTILKIPPNTTEYIPTPEWSEYLQQHKNQYTLIYVIICIHNLTTSPRNQQLIQNFTTNIFELYKTHVKTNPTQPTPIDYRVNFTKLWWGTPKPCHQAYIAIQPPPWYVPPPKHLEIQPTTTHIHKWFFHMARRTQHNQLCWVKSIVQIMIFILHKHSRFPNILRAKFYHKRPITKHMHTPSVPYYLSCRFSQIYLLR